MSAPRAFLCHSAEDKIAVRVLASRLRQAGIDVWLDEAEIRVGDSLVDTIAKGISDCDFVIVVISNRSVRSSWVKKELSLALTDEIRGRRVKVLPVLIETCEPPLVIRDKLYADLRDGAPTDLEFEKLVRSAFSFFPGAQASVGAPRPPVVSKRAHAGESAGPAVGSKIQRTWREHRGYRHLKDQRTTGSLGILLGGVIVLGATLRAGLPGAGLFQFFGVICVALGLLYTTASFLNEAALEDNANLLLAVDNIVGLIYPGSPAYMQKSNVGKHSKYFMIALRLEAAATLLVPVLGAAAFVAVVWLIMSGYRF